MNPYGSYRKLLGNSIAAMCSAIEIYNKPRIDYRDETTTVLLVNAWELVLKAVLSKNRIRIFYPKERGQPYRTLSIRDSLNAARGVFPSDVDYVAVSHNLDLLIEYRDRVVHFYNAPGLDTVLYTLAQTSIVNYRDLVLKALGRDLTDEVTLGLLPLGFSPPVNPVQFLKNAPEDEEVRTEVQEFVKDVTRAVGSVESEGGDPGRVLTVFNVSLQSVKKIESADLVVGVQEGAQGDAARMLVEKHRDPNETHPFREKDIITSKKDPNQKGKEIEYHGKPLGQYEFRAIGRKYQVKENPQWCWQDGTGAVTRYSSEYLRFLKQLSRDEVEEAVREYAQG